jgi:ribosomal-protein-alanine N-acetyltransferase
MNQTLNTISLFDIDAANTPAVQIFASLHHKAFQNIRQKSWNENEVTSLLLSESMHGFLLQKNQEPLGFVMIRLVDIEAEIITLGLDPDYQQLGYSKTLLHETLEVLRLLKVKRVFLEVRKDNNKAIRLYKAFKFRKVGVRSKYYQTLDRKQIDALTFKLEI